MGSGEPAQALKGAENLSDTALDATSRDRAPGGAAPGRDQRHPQTKTWSGLRNNPAPSPEITGHRDAHGAKKGSAHASPQHSASAPPGDVDEGWTVVPRGRRGEQDEEEERGKG